MQALQTNSFRNWKYFINLLPVAFVLWGNLHGGWYSLGNFAFTFVVLALGELLLPEDKSNINGEDNLLPDLLLVLVVVGQVLALASLIYGVYVHTLSGYWIAAAALSTGTAAGSMGIIAAHELIHRKAKFWNFLGRFLLFTVLNPYFYVHHLRIHHKSVGTAADPVSALKGETLYAFALRSIHGQLLQSLALEKNRCEKAGNWGYGLHNYVVAVYVGATLFLGVLWYFFGFWVTAAYLLQASIADLLLEYTNYIEHYGLRRAEKERVNELHSWQSDKVVSRYFLIDLSRHSDHHFHAAKPFNTLLTHEKSPVLPGGYASMFVPALIPPLWFSLVDKNIPS
ncbi:MAG: alkane 1-monooxygenase [Sphingobacteriaceae bacterium]